MAEQGKRPAELRDAARELALEALDALAQIVRVGASEHARIAAATAIMDRAYGKPGQAVKIGGEDGAAPILIRWAGSPAEGTADPAVCSPRKSADA